MTSKIRLLNVRLAFPSLFEASSVKPGQKAKYKAAFILPPTHPQMGEIKAAMEHVAKAKWGEKWQEVYNALRAGDKLAIHNGDAKSEYQGYGGNFFINASNELRPLVIGANREPLTAADGKIYSGCYVNAMVEFWAQQHVEHGKRINASLMGVQFAANGDRLAGGAVASADDFEAIPEKAQEAAKASGTGAASLF